VPVGNGGVVYVGLVVPFVVGVTGSPVPLAVCAFALMASMASRRKNTSALVRMDEEDVEAAIVNWLVVIKGRYEYGGLYRRAATRGRRYDI